MSMSDLVTRFQLAVAALWAACKTQRQFKPNWKIAKWKRRLKWLKLKSP